jgi:4-hydroxy-3-polyprenylbenzoate decarboxylase
MTHYKDLRSYLEALAGIGEVQSIVQAVSLDLEIGAISRRAGETGEAAPLFETIEGMPEMRVLGAPGGISNKPGHYLARIALALGLEPGASGREIIEALVAARSRPLIPPRRVATGPCKEVIITGSTVDLTKLPAPLLHDGDGGRYMNTFGVICCETPDKSWRSWSIARIMLVDKMRMSGLIAPFQHIGMVRKTWSDIGEPMPFALALGVEPFIPYVGGMPLPAYMSEGDYVGAYFGEPVEVVQCETVDLQVPATAEIVIEGYVALNESVQEGPMGEYAGYLWKGSSAKPVYHATAITHRRNPILPVSVAGEPVEENHTAWGVPNAAEIVYELRQAGLPIATAWTPFESANHWYVIAATRDWRAKLPGMTGEQFCRKVGEILFASKAGSGTPKYIMVNDDVDITNVKEVVWAFATRNHAGPLGEVVFNNEATQPLVAYLGSDEKMSMKTTKVVYNALDPEHLNGVMPVRSAFHYAYPKSIQDKVLRNWHAYGYSAADGTRGSLK